MLLAILMFFEQAGFVFAATFTPNMDKRNSSAPFAAGALVQGKYTPVGGASESDALYFSRGNQISGDYYQNFDSTQGSIVFWVTPEWNGNDGKIHVLTRSGLTGSSGMIYKYSDNTLRLAHGALLLVSLDISSWTAGNTYFIVARWDKKNTLDGTNYGSLSINDVHTFSSTTAPTAESGESTFYIGSDSSMRYPASSVIEGLTVYRRPLFDGTYGVDAGNGDEINLIYNSGTGKDPTLVTGSWDVVFAMPTNASTGAITTGTGNAWSHPHSSNLLGGTNGKNGFMMDGTYTNDGWAVENPAFEFASASTTFTAGGAKRNSGGPFASGVMVSGWQGQNTYRDALAASAGSQISGNFYQNWDDNQGSISFWITPEWNGNDGLQHTIFSDGISLMVFKRTNNTLAFRRVGIADIVSTDISSWVAGSTYFVVVRWDTKNAIDGTNYGSISINDVHTLGTTSSWTSVTPSDLQFTGNNGGILSAPDAIIEGLTIYRRPLWDGTYGIDVGNGDEINQIYNSGTGKDPTLVTGSWDVVFALPTNASTGALATGTGNAWSHPHASNLLYTSTTNTGGFMMGADVATDGWGGISGNTQNLILQPDGTSGIDTYVREDLSSTNYANATSFYVAAGAGVRRNALLNFDISNIPTNATVSSAQLTLTTLSSSSGPRSFSLWSILPANNGWDESATWDYAKPGTNMRWLGDSSNDGGTDAGSSVSGTDYNSSLLGTLTYEAGSGGGYPITSDLDTAQVQSWITNGFYGVIMTHNSSAWSWVASEDATADRRPKLEINYTAPPTTASLSSSEKIFSGGYKYTSSGADQGIYRSFTATSGGDYVLRAVGNSDGTCSPQVKITRADGTTEITHLNGTTTSTRTAPDVYIFTWESPAAESEQVQLINTASSGTCYWHQVEVLSNLISNPSMETGSGDPWIPTGWSNDLLTAGESSQDVLTIHSGGSSVKFTSSTVAHNLRIGNTPSVNTFLSSGIFSKSSAGQYGQIGTGYPAWSHFQYNASTYLKDSSSSTSWKQNFFISRVAASNNIMFRINGPGSGATQNYDDSYTFSLSPVSLTVTPASLANSTETTGIRVDGTDMLTQPITNLTATSGTARFKYTPRHSFATADLFGV
ncbi:MAG: hypothetical protein UW36_C0006G0025, partial [candidate division WWE3 bacterium GW2011_GWA2_44_16]